MPIKRRTNWYDSDTYLGWMTLFFTFLMIVPLSNTWAFVDRRTMLNSVIWWIAVSLWSCIVDGCVGDFSRWSNNNLVEKIIQWIVNISNKRLKILSHAVGSRQDVLTFISNQSPTTMTPPVTFESNLCRTLTNQEKRMQMKPKVFHLFFHRMQMKSSTIYFKNILLSDE